MGRWWVLAALVALAACERQWDPPPPPPAAKPPSTPVPGPDPALGPGGGGGPAPETTPAPPPPPDDGDPPPEPGLVEHTNVLGGLVVTYYSYQPLNSYDPWSALQLAEAWGAGAGETYGVCGRGRCFCRVRSGTALAATICYDTAFVQGGDPDIGMSGYAIVTPGSCAQVEPSGCPVPSNPARAPWH